MQGCNSSVPKVGRQPAFPCGQGGYNLTTNICPYSTCSLPQEPAGLRSVSLGKAEASLQAEVHSEQLVASRKAKTLCSQMPFQLGTKSTGTSELNCSSIECNQSAPVQPAGRAAVPAERARAGSGAAPASISSEERGAGAEPPLGRARSAPRRPRGGMGASVRGRDGDGALEDGVGGDGGVSGMARMGIECRRMAWVGMEHRRMVWVGMEECRA